MRSKCCDVDSINKTFKNFNNDLLAMHFNVRSLSRNVDKLNTFLSRLNSTATAIGVWKTKLKENAIFANINLPGYKFISRNSVITCAGGVGLYIK